MSLIVHDIKNFILGLMFGQQRVLVLEGAVPSRLVWVFIQRAWKR
jgi:hypothetical protein